MINQKAMQQASLSESRPSLAKGYSSQRKIVVIPAPILSCFPMEASLMIDSVQHPNSNGYISFGKNDRHNQKKEKTGPIGHMHHNTAVNDSFSVIARPSPPTHVPFPPITGRVGRARPTHISSFLCLIKVLTTATGIEAAPPANLPFIARSRLT